MESAKSPAEVREALASESVGNSYDALLIDLNYTRDTTSGQEGLDLLSEIVALDSNLPVIVMTAWGNVELAVEAMRRGARDFVQKPWENERLLAILRTQVELHRALQRAERLAAENRLLQAQGRPEFIAAAASMQPVLEAMARVGPSDANVLITGEHGSGKEVVAQTLHALSSRASRPLVAVNTGALAEGLFESELFGHVKGAFTDARTDRIGRFELADGGTIFLDEIGNVPIRQQAKLLRVLESGEIERAGLLALAQDRCARDLGHQHRSCRPHAPQDSFARIFSSASTLSRFTCRRCASVAKIFPRWPFISCGVMLRGIAARSMALSRPRCRLMAQYAWPGNVRELEHTLERAVLMCRGREIQPADLGLNMQRPQAQNLEELSLEAVEALLFARRCSAFRAISARRRKRWA